MSEPNQASNGWIDTVSDFQGGSNVKRITDRGYDTRLGTEIRDRVDPEFQQTTHAGVFYYEQSAVAKFLPENCLRAFAAFAGDRREVPTCVESPPVVPFGTRRCQDLVVQIRDWLRFPMPRRVVIRRCHQIGRQIASHEAQQAGQRRGATTVHTGDQNRYSFFFPGHFKFQDATRGHSTVCSARR